MKTHYVEYDDDEATYRCTNCKELVPLYPGDYDMRIAQLEHQVNVLQKALDNSKKSGR